MLYLFHRFLIVALNMYIFVTTISCSSILSCLNKVIPYTLNNNRPTDREISWLLMLFGLFVC